MYITTLFLKRFVIWHDRNWSHMHKKVNFLNILKLSRILYQDMFAQYNNIFLFLYYRMFNHISSLKSGYCFEFGQWKSWLVMIQTNISDHQMYKYMWGRFWRILMIQICKVPIPLCNQGVPIIISNSTTDWLS